jgi:isopentenyl-diphosphate delta-isomerase
MTERPASDSSDEPQISTRKEDHLDLCADEGVEYRSKTTLLEEVELLHDSLPEVAVDEVDLGVEVFGRTLRLPCLMTGMTGGADRAASINRMLAEAAQELGMAMGVGSQRAMLDHPELAATYRVREVAPDILLFGNIGAVQAADLEVDRAAGLVDAIEADALCIHLNPGQELIQPEGDRDFRGCLDGIARLVEGLEVPVIVKETGCGLSPRTLDKIVSTGAKWVDTSGAGGTTWIGVETLRTPPSERSLGEMLWEWGTPTAASITYAVRRGLNVIGAGGLRNAYDVARAIALGATFAGMALPWFRAIDSGGPEAAVAYGHRLARGLRTICALTGSPDLGALRRADRIVGPRLRRWIEHDVE